MPDGSLMAFVWPERSEDNRMNVELSTKQQRMLDEVLHGLRQPQKKLPSKFFYNERGSELFEQITQLKEYYPTRTEMKILRQNIDEITACIDSGAVIIELGSGSSQKIRLLLTHFHDVAAYVPVDISANYLLKVVQKLKNDYPDLLVKPVCTDYTHPFEIPAIDHPLKRHIAFYPGSTIGNFRPEQARGFLQMISGLVGPDGGLIIGVDLKKDRTVLEKAYNDRNGVTAAFNKNMLVRLNHELGADFKVEKFRHHAFYNDGESRIEMHLISMDDQIVHLDGEEVFFGEGQSIHTENSYKYSVEDFQGLVSDYFEVKNVWTDRDRLFSIQYLAR